MRVAAGLADRAGKASDDAVEGSNNTSPLGQSVAKISLAIHHSMSRCIERPSSWKSSSPSRSSSLLWSSVVVLRMLHSSTFNWHQICIAMTRVHLGVFE
eukprot:2313402-Amphidinium_carterae.1